MVYIDDPSRFVLSFFFLIPVVIQFRYYRFTQARGYLQFSTLLFLFLVDNTLVSLGGKSQVLESVSTLIFRIIHILIVSVSDDIAKRIPPKTAFWKVSFTIAIIISFTTELGSYLQILPSTYSMIHNWISYLLTTIAGLIVVYAYGVSSVEIKTFRTIYSKRIWITLGIFLFLLGFVQLSEVANQQLSIVSPENIIFSGFATLFLLTIISILLLAVALFFPETMLLSHLQLLQIMQLYMHSGNDDHEQPSSSYDPAAYLMEYLEEVADNFRE